MAFSSRQCLLPLTCSSSKGPAKAIGGFLQGYDPSKAKAAQKTKISVAKKKILDDPIEDIEMEDFDEEGDEERLSDSDASDKEEEEEERSIIVIGSSDTEGTDGGDEVVSLIVFRRQGPTDW